MKPLSIIISAGAVFGTITAYYALPDSWRPAVVAEVRAGDEAANARMDAIEEVDTEDRLDRLYINLSNVVARLAQNPNDDVSLRAKISLERQIDKAEARLGQLRAK